MSFDEDFRDETGLTPWEKLDVAKEYIENGDLDGIRDLLPPDPNSENKMLIILKQILKKTDEQNKLLTKIAVTVSKLHLQGELNEKTFHELDEFLKPYYDKSNLTDDY